jgi:hypothetical protein
MKPALAILGLLLGIFLLTLAGRWFDCVMGAKFGFFLLSDTHRIQAACSSLLDPFWMFR